MDFIKNTSNNLNGYSSMAIEIIPKLVISLIILLMFLSVAQYIKSLISNMGKSSENNILPESEMKYYTQDEIKKLQRNITKQELIYSQFSNIIYYLLIFIGSIIAITNMGIQQSSVIAILGTFGLALGLASQGILTNIISGFYIAINNFFEIDDKINVNNVTGRIVDVNLFNTTLIDSNNNYINMPNDVLRNNVITKFID